MTIRIIHNEDTNNSIKTKNNKTQQKWSKQHTHFFEIVDKTSKEQKKTTTNETRINYGEIVVTKGLVVISE